MSDNFKWAWRIMVIVIGIAWGAGKMQGVYDLLVIVATIVFISSLVYDVTLLFQRKKESDADN